VPVEEDLHDRRAQRLSAQVRTDDARAGALEGGGGVSGTTIWRHGNDYEYRATISRGSLDAETSALRLEGEGKRPDGVVAAHVIEGKIDRDTVTGTFKFGNDRGEFTFRRQ
jgi:hypothetical protein